MRFIVEALGQTTVCGGINVQRGSLKGRPAMEVCFFFFFFFFSRFFLFSFNFELKKKKTHMQNGVVLVVLTATLTEL